MTTVSIIGLGQIGNHLAKRLYGTWKCHRTGRKDGKTSVEVIADDALGVDPDVVFLAISTKDDGFEAASYIDHIISRGIPVVTCEKGALANYASNLQLHIQSGLLGFSAAVGGGTQLLPYLKERRPNRRPTSIDMVINGTLNFIFHQVTGTSTLGEACAEAQRLGYAEPGATDPLSLIKGEVADVLKKTCVFYNVVLSDGNWLRPDDFVCFPLDEESLELLARQASSYRMIVSFSNRAEISQNEFFQGGFVPRHTGRAGDWYMRAGFRLIHNNPEFEWLPGGVGNGICVTEGKLGAGGKYTLLGPGAGAEATTTAMLNDAYRILEWLHEPRENLISARKAAELFLGRKATV